MGHSRWQRIGRRVEPFIQCACGRYQGWQSYAHLPYNDMNGIMETARRKAEAEGWRIVNGRWHCWRCVKRLPQA